MPEPVYQLLNFDFSTADAEMPQFSFHKDEVVLEFIDWQNKLIKIVFYNVIRLQWNENMEYEPQEIHDDSVYEVVHSPWVAEYKQVCDTPVLYKHYKFCFNAAGVFDIACESFKKL